MSAQAHAHMEAKREGSRMFNFIHEQTRIHFHACTSSTPLALSMSMMPGAAFDDPMLLLPSCQHSQNFGGNKKTALQNSKPSFIQPSFG